jgi:hypothetical protein
MNKIRNIPGNRIILIMLEYLTQIMLEYPNFARIIQIMLEYLTQIIPGRTYKTSTFMLCVRFHLIHCHEENFTNMNVPYSCLENIFYNEFGALLLSTFQELNLVAQFQARVLCKMIINTSKSTREIINKSVNFD